MFCKCCRYNLKGVDKACPECGRVFDAANPKTYRKRVGFPKLERWIGQGLVVLLVIALIAIGVIEWRYQREAGVVEQLGGKAQWSDDAHQWADGIPFLHDRLQHVDSLYFGGNQLTMLPPEIGNLTKLELLWLDGNQFTSLPPEIGQLTNLRWLFVRYNQLTMLLSEIGKLANLEILWLSNNQLTTLSPDFGKLAKVCELKLSGNQLTTLPPELGKLTKLLALNLAGNPITDADLEHLKSLKNLIRLGLRRTKVTQLGVVALKRALPNCVVLSDFD